MLRYAHPSSLRLTLCTPHSSGIASLASGAFPEFEQFQFVTKASMMISKISHIIFSILLAAVTAAPSLAQEDVRGVKLHGEEGSKVIEEKCLTCHNRQRIDKAIKEREEMVQVIKRMEKKGAVLTAKEHQVIGHFWGQKLYKTEDAGTKPKH
jgi:hypothetical protein